MLSIPEKSWFLVVSAVTLIAGIFLISYLVPRNENGSFICSFTNPTSPSSSESALSTQISKTILHYATSTIVPQQSIHEISISLAVLLKRRPCNFLVFGLGLDSRMWAAFNPTGYTLFLEEDLSWYKQVMKDAPFLNAKHVKYKTQLQQADDLLRNYKKEKYCLPAKAYVKGNGHCKLALSDLPKEVYEREWDLIMIDAPKGYFNEAPGRMAAIWTAAVMSKGRKGKGVTDVFLHDVNRKVEKNFALEFLCQKNRVGGVERLWHFQIPPNSTSAADRFC